MVAANGRPTGARGRRGGAGLAVAGPRLVSVGAAAGLLGVCDETVYRLARRRVIAYFRDPETGSWRFVVASIEAYLAANTVPARPRVVDVTPASRERKPRARQTAARATGNEPWRGSVFGTRPAAGGEQTNGAASSAARGARRQRSAQTP